MKWACMLKVPKDNRTKGRGFNEESKKDEDETQQNNVTPEKNVMTSPNQKPGGYKFALATCGWSTRASEPARARFWFGLSSSLVLPITFMHTTACRGPALVFSATERSISPWNVPPLVLSFCAIHPASMLSLRPSLHYVVFCFALIGGAAWRLM